MIKYNAKYAELPQILLGNCPLTNKCLNPITVHQTNNFSFYSFAIQDYVLPNVMTRRESIFGSTMIDTIRGSNFSRHIFAPL